MVHKRTVIPEKVLNQAMVQLNVRVPVRLRSKLEAYLQYLDDSIVPPSERLKASRNWPASVQAVITQALEDFLDDHPTKRRPGPEPDSAPAPITPIPKQPATHQPIPKYQTRVP